MPSNFGYIVFAVFAQFRYERCLNCYMLCSDYRLPSDNAQHKSTNLIQVAYPDIHRQDSSHTLTTVFIAPLTLASSLA